MCLISLRLVAEMYFSSETRSGYSVIGRIDQTIFAIQFSIFSRSLAFDIQLSVACVTFLLVWCSFLGLLSQSRLRLWIALG